MIARLAFAALVSAALPAASALAQDTAPAAEQLSLEQRTALRCSAAFALVAQGQARGDPQALEHPPLAERGREFFVRFSARLMDEEGLSREAVAGLLMAEAKALFDGGTVDEIMPCLLLLDASGL